MDKIGFIGTGVMGSALVKGILNKRISAKEDIFVYDTVSEKAKALANKTGVSIAYDLETICSSCLYIFLCVKPAAFGDLLRSLGKFLCDSRVLVSIAAGITTNTIRRIIGDRHTVIRTMPNTPLLVNEGMTIICDDGGIDERSLDFVIKIFSSLGDTCRLPEGLMSAATALSGSSPAYGYMFIEAMARSAQRMGIPEKEALRLAAKSIRGAAQMVLETKEDPEKLRNDVCSPGGTTIEAIRVFNEKGLGSIVDDAMRACARKADLLGKDSDE